MSTCTDTWQVSRGAEVTWYGVAGLFWLLLVVGLVVSTACPIGTEGHPTNAELNRRFVTQEMDFAALGSMLDADGPVLRKLRQPVDFAELGAARAAGYRELLRDIGASTVRYLPDAHDTAAVVLVGDPQMSTRVYFVHVGAGEVTSTSARRAAIGHYWRGPGIYEMTRDSALDGRWFIQRKVEVSVVFSPY